MRKPTAAGFIILALCFASAGMLGAQNHNQSSATDPGAQYDAWLATNSFVFFGFEQPLARSPKRGKKVGFRRANQSAAQQLATAGSLKVEYFSRKLANRGDMIAFYPPHRPTHMILCIEGRREQLANRRYNPSVQRVSLSTRKVETVLRGMSNCDGIRTTPWGTIVATEEVSRGGVYEILDPLRLTNGKVIGRSSGKVSHPNLVAKRPAMPTISWEGLTVLPSGVVIAGDELRPGSKQPDANGGSIFKFVPDKLHDGRRITDLGQSPLISGRTFAMQVSCVSAKQQFGQGCEVGSAVWVEVNAATARADADRKHATGYYRPEDLHKDPAYKGEGIRFCWANTGNSGARNYGEVLCAVDRKPTVASATSRTVTVVRFIQGDRQLSQPDNLAFQPGTGILYVIEDAGPGDIWACLPDGKDRDLRSDGCVRALSVRDGSAEPTGFTFDPTGRVAYFVLQHSNDRRMPKVDGYPTDDLIKVTGFAVD